MRITFALGGAITASATGRTLTGDVVRFGVPGRTSVGKLRVRPGALRFPEDLTRVKLTREHDRDEARGHLAMLDIDGKRIRAAMRVSDGPLGDAAIQEAVDHTRDGFSFDVIDARVEGDEIVDALVVAIGQVGIPAYDDSRIDQIAASQTHQGTTNRGDSMTNEQRERLAALLAKKRDDLTPEEMREVIDLQALAADNPEEQPAEQPAEQRVEVPAQRQAPAAERVAASLPGVPAGAPRPATRTRAVDPLTDFLRTIVEGYAGSSPNPQAITAALQDVTYSAHSGNIQQPAWAGELWSGVQYEPTFTPLLGSGNLTGVKFQGWRWVVKPELADYAGDKAAVPSNALDTEVVEGTAARMAVGHDLDRAFYDFPNEAFLRSYVEAARESWGPKLDAKVEAWLLANGIPGTLGGVAIPAQSSLFAAVAKAMRALRRNLAGKGTFVIVSDNDFDSLMDVTNFEVPAYLEMFGVTPESFIPSAGQTDGTVTVGVKQTASVLTLPGSPIRASAQHLANGGIDEAFFGYWAIQQHHSKGLVDVTFTTA